jgi:hypothetical protein
MKYAIFMVDGNFFLSSTPLDGYTKCLPIEVDKPEFDSRIQTQAPAEYLPMPDCVIESWRLFDKPVDLIQREQISNVKQEASEAILAKYPIYKQLNMLAEGTALLLARGDSPWTEAQTTRAAELMAIRAEIQAIRSASDDREAAVLDAETGADVCLIMDTPHPGGSRQWINGEWV